MTRWFTIACCGVCIAAFAQVRQDDVNHEREEQRRQLKAMQMELQASRETGVGNSGGGPLLRRGKSGAPTIEMTQAERNFTLNEFAGFRFGEPISDTDALNGCNLQSPFRAFTRLQLSCTSFGHKLCGVRLYGRIGDWDEQSIAEETEFLRDMLSSQYGINAWHSQPEPARGVQFVFKNDNVKISILSNGNFLSLGVVNLRLQAEDSQLREAARRAVKFPAEADFMCLERIAASNPVEITDSVDDLTKLPSGFGIGKQELDATSVKFDGNGEITTVKVCTRVMDNGYEYVFVFRTLEIAPDGRILSIGAETRK